MSGHVRLERWAVVVPAPESPFRAPEMGGQCLSGRVHGHPTEADGKAVRTSPLASVNGRVVTTASGTVYELGEPHPDYLAWLDTAGIAFDPENPIRARRASR
jgi:hypothetical protein